MIRRRLQKLIRWAMNYGPSEVELPVMSTSSTIGAEGMNFTFYTASGGHIVEYRTYDAKNDKRINNLHIITHDQDVGERIGQIVTTEILRNH
jgi:hypothetical protein